ncbi:MAG: hypothetical protein ACREIP_19110, partial [Alphaproteobacteria bacterium]
MARTMISASARAGIGPRFRMVCAITACLLSLCGAQALAQVPKEFHGEWSSQPPLCEQKNGEVDLLTVNESSFGFYEIGCEKLANPRKGPTGTVTFDAVCFKGGSPETKGEVELSREGDD